MEENYDDNVDHYNIEDVLDYNQDERKADDEIESVLFPKLAEYLVSQRAKEIRLDLNDVLFDDDVFQWINWKKYKFSDDLMYYVYLCFFIENLVLHEKVVFTCRDRGLSPLYNKFKILLGEFEGEFLQNDLIEFIWDPTIFSISNIKIGKLGLSTSLVSSEWGKSRLESLLNGNFNLDYYTGSDGTEFIKSDILHNNLDLSNVTDPGYWFLYKTKQQKYSNVTHVYQKAYANVIKALREDVQLAQMFGHPKKLFVPPIAANILSKDSDDLLSLIMENRKKFTNVRDEFTRYEQIITSDKSTLKDALSARDKLISRLNILSRTWNDTHSIHLADFKDVAQLFPELLNNPNFDASDIKGIITAGLSKPIIEGLRKFSLKNIFYLFSIKESFRKLSNPLKALEEIEVFKAPQKLRELDVEKLIASQYIIKSNSSGKTK